MITRPPLYSSTVQDQFACLHQDVELLFAVVMQQIECRHKAEQWTEPAPTPSSAKCCRLPLPVVNIPVREPALAC